jgi:hypothetical protein
MREVVRTLRVRRGSIDIKQSLQEMITHFL